MCILKTAFFKIVPDNIKGKSYPKSYNRNIAPKSWQANDSVQPIQKKMYVHLSSEMVLV